MGDIPDNLSEFFSAPKTVLFREDCYFDKNSKHWIPQEECEKFKKREACSKLHKALFVVQESPTGIARCRFCGQLIPKRAYRLGYPLTDCRGEHGILTAWVHIPCSHNIVRHAIELSYDPLQFEPYQIYINELKELELKLAQLSNHEAVVSNHEIKESDTASSHNSEIKKEIKNAVKPEFKNEISDTIKKELDNDTIKTELPDELNTSTKDESSNNDIKKEKKKYTRKKVNNDNSKLEENNDNQIKNNNKTTRNRKKPTTNHLEEKEKEKKVLAEKLLLEETKNVNLMNNLSFVISALSDICCEWTILDKLSQCILIMYAIDPMTDKENDAAEVLDKMVKKKISEQEEPPKELITTLLPFQKEGLAWMVKQELISSCKGGILADEMGMGKTIQAIALILKNKTFPDEQLPDISLESKKPEFDSPSKNIGKSSKLKKNTFLPTGVGRTLIVAPLAAVMQWKQEIEKFTKKNSLRILLYHGQCREALIRDLHQYDVVITTYSTVESDYRRIVNLHKVPCRYCGRLYLPEKLRFHQRYFCGPESRRTTRQAKTDKKSLQAAKKAMKTLDIGKNDYTAPTITNMYREIMREANLPADPASHCSWLNTHWAKIKQLKVREELHNNGKINPEVASKVLSILEQSTDDNEIIIDEELLKSNDEKTGILDISPEKLEKLDNTLKQLPQTKSEDLFKDTIQSDAPQQPPKQKSENIIEHSLQAELKDSPKQPPQKKIKTDQNGQTKQFDKSETSSDHQNDKYTEAAFCRNKVGLSETEIRKLRVNELQKLLQDLGRPAYGVKIELVNRLLLLLFPESFEDSNKNETPSNTDINKTAKKNIKVKNVKSSPNKITKTSSTNKLSKMKDSNNKVMTPDTSSKLSSGRNSFKSSVKSIKNTNPRPVRACRQEPKIIPNDNDENASFLNESSDTIDKLSISEESSYHISQVMQSESSDTTESSLFSSKDDELEEEDEDDFEDEDEDDESIIEVQPYKKRTAPIQKKVSKSTYSEKPIDDLDRLHTIDSCQDLEDDEEQGLQMNLSPLHGIKWMRIILDEAHRIKSRTTSTAKAVYSLQSTHGKWCLTGTPLQNRVGELYSLVRFLRFDPFAFYFCQKKDCGCKSLHYRFQDNKFCIKCGHARMAHYSCFNRQILTPIKNYGYQGQGREALRVLKEEVLDKILLRRTKNERAQDINLPKLTVVIRRDTLIPAERDFYESLYKQTRTQFDTYVDEGTLLHNYAHIFDLLSRLRQAVDHPYMIVYGNLAAKNQPIPAPGRGDCDVCCLCHDDINDAQRVVSGCKHVFHKDCIRQYIATAPDETKSDPLGCPICFCRLTLDISLEASESEDAESQDSINDEETSEAFEITSQSKSQQEPQTSRYSGILSRIKVSEFKSSTKIEALVSELTNIQQNYPDDKAIVFSQYTSFLEIIEWRLKKGGFTCAKLVGSLSLAARTNILYLFNTNPLLKIVLISLKAGGEGLNLQIANHIFLMDPWWNPAAEMQAIQRAHRIGQLKPVRGVRFICEDTIEEKMLQLQEKKQLVFDGTIGANDAAITKLTTEDLKFLFNC